MELFLLLLIILLFSIQIPVVVSNVYLMKLVIQLIQDNKQQKKKLTILENRVRIQEWTQLKLLQALRSQLSDL